MRVVGFWYCEMFWEQIRTSLQSSSINFPKMLAELRMTYKTNLFTLYSLVYASACSICPSGDIGEKSL